jgi:phosphoglycolate phosphatase-like HAD superfamily hydrolase
VSSEPTLIIFDIDGTLVDSTAVHHAALTTALLAIGLDPRTKPWGAYRHYTDSGVLDELCRDTGGVGATAAELARLDTLTRHEFAAAALVRPIVEIAGARRLLEELTAAADILIGFATGSMRGTAAVKLMALGLDPQSQVLATGSDFLSREHIVQSVLAEGERRLGDSLNTVMLGDGGWDAQTARGLDLAFVGVETGLHTFGPDADLVVRDLTGLSPADLRSIARPFARRN